jgi:hypothetical protein
MTTGPVELRDSGGVQVYYVLPVREARTENGIAAGVFEHVSTWPSEDIAQAQVAELEAADARRQELAAEARDAITQLSRAEAADPDADAEAVRNVVNCLELLLAALQESSLII